MELKNLKQTITVQGLKDEIDYSVRLFKPTSLSEEEVVELELWELWYSPGHKCSKQMYSLEVVACDEEVEEGNCKENTQGTVKEEEVMPHISLNAMTGVISYQTMRVKGHVKKQVLHLLVDCGSTHNFLDLHAAKRLGCKMRKTCPLQVSVANGH
ncbi:retrotransposable element Tf2 [Tanacetum coccineum]